MTESFEHHLKSYKLWTWLYSQLLTTEIVQQSEIIEYAENNNLGSKKSILTFLSEYLDSKLILELELSTNTVGRPKKGYSRYKNKTIDLTIINMAELPPVVLEFIKIQSKEEKSLPTDVMIKLVAWAYNFLVSMQFPDNKPIFDLPSHLKSTSDVFNRIYKD